MAATATEPITATDADPTTTLAVEAQHLATRLRTIAADIEAWSIGDLRRALDEAAADATLIEDTAAELAGYAS